MVRKGGDFINLRKNTALVPVAVNVFPAKCIKRRTCNRNLSHVSVR